MATAKTNAVRLLDRLGVRYELRSEHFLDRCQIEEVAGPHGV